MAILQLKNLYSLPRLFFSKLSKVFRLCKQLDSGEELINWMVECWGNIAMVDYPYPADFLSPLPAWPINVRILFYCLI